MKFIIEEYQYKERDVTEVLEGLFNLFDERQQLRQDPDLYRSIRLRDEIAERYNMIPNFFISANIDATNLRHRNGQVHTLSEVLSLYASCETKY